MADVPIMAERRQPGGDDPPYLHPAYRSTVLRAPTRPPLRVGYGPVELAGPLPSAIVHGREHAVAADLTRQHADAPLGERIVLHGQITDARGNPATGVLIEIWQANAAGRYAHDGDRHPAPLDPNFTGAGRVFTGADGSYRFLTIRPGAYPWKNHPNAWRPAHIHFSVFGRAFT